MGRVSSKLGEIATNLAEITKDLRALYQTGALDNFFPIPALERTIKMLVTYNEEYALNAETYKMLMDQAHDHHRACMVDAYKLLGIDGSDGEIRYKWVALAISNLVDENKMLKNRNIEKPSKRSARPVDHSPSCRAVLFNGNQDCTCGEDERWEQEVLSGLRND
jgi:hypothetical protein